MSSRRSIPLSKLDKVCLSLKDIKCYTTEERNWVKQFKNTPLVVRRDIIRLLEREQTLSIAKGMHNLEDHIEIPFIGRFLIKPSRKKYIDLCKKYPDKTTDEIVEMVKAFHKKRKVGRSVKPVNFDLDDNRLTS
jgi:hypothetical protein